MNNLKYIFVWFKLHKVYRELPHYYVVGYNNSIVLKHNILFGIPNLVGITIAGPIQKIKSFKEELTYLR